MTKNVITINLKNEDQKQGSNDKIFNLFIRLTSVSQKIARERSRRKRR